MKVILKWIQALLRTYREYRSWKKLGFKRKPTFVEYEERRVKQNPGRFTQSEVDIKERNPIWLHHLKMKPDSCAYDTFEEWNAANNKWESDGKQLFEKL